MGEFKRNFKTGKMEYWENGKKVDEITEMAIPMKSKTKAKASTKKSSPSKSKKK